MSAMLTAGKSFSLGREDLAIALHYLDPENAR